MQRKIKYENIDFNNSFKILYNPAIDLLINGKWFFKEIRQDYIGCEKISFYFNMNQFAFYFNMNQFASDIESFGVGLGIAKQNNYLHYIYFSISKSYKLINSAIFRYIEIRNEKAKFETYLKQENVLSVI